MASETEFDSSEREQHCHVADAQTVLYEDTEQKGKATNPF